MSRATRGSAARRRDGKRPRRPRARRGAGAPVSLGEPVTSGIDLTGTWKLDMTRSEPLDRGPWASPTWPSRAPVHKSVTPSTDRAHGQRT